MRSVVGLVVTYGDRAGYCLQAIESMVRNGVDLIVLVANGVTPSALLRLQGCADASGDARVNIVICDHNLGSAYGFGRGLEVACRAGREWIWILDDDNVAEDGALSAALEQLRIHRQRLGEPVCGACVRDTDEAHQAILGGCSPQDAIPPAGSFFGVDLVHRIKSRMSRTRLTSDSALMLGSLPYAPYGGLLLPAEVVSRVDGPRDDFVLYFDDVDFTSRIVSFGVPIFLCTQSRVAEIASKWTQGGSRKEGRGGYLRGMVKSRDERRIYYSYRNCVYLDWRRCGGPLVRARFLLNAVTYSLNVLLVCIQERAGYFIPLFLWAVVNGLRGRLGRRHF